MHDYSRACVRLVRLYALAGVYVWLILIVRVLYVRVHVYVRGIMDFRWTLFTGNAIN